MFQHDENGGGKKVYTSKEWSEPAAKEVKRPPQNRLEPLSPSLLTSQRIPRNNLRKEGRRVRDWERGDEAKKEEGRRVDCRSGHVESHKRMGVRVSASSGRGGVSSTSRVWVWSVQDAETCNSGRRMSSRAVPRGKIPARLGKGSHRGSCRGSAFGFCRFVHLRRASTET